MPAVRGSKATRVNKSLKVKVAESEVTRATKFSNGCFKCPYCDKVPGNDWFRHVKTHCPSDIPCAMPGCDAVFRQMPNMRAHVKAVHRHERNMVCDHPVVDAAGVQTTCNVAYAWEKGLENHRLRVHNWQRGDAKHATWKNDVDARSRRARRATEHIADHEPESWGPIYPPAAPSAVLAANVLAHGAASEIRVQPHGLCALIDLLPDTPGGELPPLPLEIRRAARLPLFDHFASPSPRGETPALGSSPCSATASPELCTPPDTVARVALKKDALAAPAPALSLSPHAWTSSSPNSSLPALSPSMPMYWASPAPGAQYLYGDDGYQVSPTAYAQDYTLGWQESYQEFEQGSSSSSSRALPMHAMRPNGLGLQFQ
ncbi:uncharacterized protein BXZ73DRAFT_106163 [Epithele typhae]|uniref:uncharacterized protein n=1 Tax=Epithele typhae TaxID=378194 RepID=UPI002008854D|nr:uncharacterized protein BXZ73DRAFT_106163 [Epithele typhae]KAH9915434.1 hypothetical protein BXZ73DRAFT_106163 [Epithele typhae]